MAINKKPVLVHVTNNLNNRGGIERLLGAALPLLTDRYEVHAVAYKEKGCYYESFPEQGVHTHFLPRYGTLSPRNLSNYASLFRELNARIVHAHARSANVFCSLAARLARVPVRVAHIHTYSLELYWHSAHRLQHVLRRLTDGVVHCIATDKIILPAQCMLAPYSRAMPLVPEERFAIVHSGVDFSGIQTVRPEYDLRLQHGLARDELILGFAGRLVPSKGIALLPEIAESLVRSGRRFRIVILGDGGGEPVEQLKQAATQIGDGQRFLFLGWVDAPEQYYPQFDAFLFPSEPGTEAWSLSLTEAALHNIPVIARKTEITMEYSNYYSRIVFLEDDKEPAQTLERALKTPDMPDERVAAFTMPRFADALDTLYTSLLRND